MGSSMLSAAIKSIRMDFPGHNSMLYIMITGIYVLGFVVGPLLWAPMSEIYGRRLLFVLTYIPFTAFNAACCGAQDMNTLLVLRFFAGTFGSSTMTNSGGTIADMFSPAQRGAAMGIFAMVSWNQSLGFRWRKLWAELTTRCPCSVPPSAPSVAASSPTPRGGSGSRA